MPSAVRALSNIETAEEANDEQFDVIKALAAEFGKREMNAKEALYIALDALFTFVMNLETETERRQFVEKKKCKWGKIAQDNPFQPFVKLAFCGEGISDGSRSQYAKVLRYAQFKRDRTVSVADWLRASGGIEGLYDAANTFFPSARAHVERTKLNEAVQSIKSRQLSDTFALGETAMTEGFVMAILHVDAHGKAHVVEYTERDQLKLETLFEKLAKADARKADAVAKPLFPLCRAIRLLTSIVPAGKRDADRLITLTREKNEAGSEVIAVRALSTTYEGPLGEVLLSDPIDWVPMEGMVAFAQADAKRFCDAFNVDGKWACHGSVIEHEHETVADIVLLDRLPTVPENGRYYERRQDFRQVAPLNVEYDAAASFYREGRRNTKPGIYQGVLRLSWTGEHLRYEPYPGLGVHHDIFGLRVDPSFGDDRMFHYDMVAGLCEIAAELQSDLTGWLVDTPEEDNCAIFIDHAAGKERISLVVPLVKTVQGHTTQTNVAL